MQISNTTIAGLIKIMIIIIGALLVYFDKATLPEATAFVVGAGGVATAMGLTAAKDDKL